MIPAEFANNAKRILKQDENVIGLAVSWVTALVSALILKRTDFQ